MKGDPVKISITSFRIYFPVVIAVLAVVGLTYNAQVQSTETVDLYVPENGLNWLAFNDGMDKALEENKPIIVDVFADWCQPCKMMDKEIYANEKIIEYLNKNFIAIKVDGESENKIKFDEKEYSEREWSMNMSVMAYPTTMFFEPGGKQITRLEGALLDVPLFLDILEYVKLNPSYESITKAVDFDTWRKSKGEQN